MLSPALCYAQTEGRWTHLGSGPARAAVLRSPPPFALTPAWSASTDGLGNTITFVPQVGVAVSDGPLGSAVYAVGRVSPPSQPANQWKLFAFSRNSGVVQWSRPIASVIVDSWSSPTLDVSRAQVIVASGQSVAAFDSVSGTPRWTTALQRSVVNASPLIVDDIEFPRLFITDYDGFGSSASLYCINLAPFDQHKNPFNPGAIVWCVPIGASSGNSAAYLPLRDGGVGYVYIATVGAIAGDPGHILAFDPTKTESVSAEWDFENPEPEGFFGGLCVRKASMLCDSPDVFAATYAFAGGLTAGNMVKLDGKSGTLRWSVQSNRTSSIPVPIGDGRIALSTGISGFGSVPAIELFEDSFTSASRLWNSALATWEDADHDGNLDPGEYARYGGWTQHPIAYVWAGRTSLATGVLPPVAGQAPSDTFAVLNLDLSPDSSSFATQTASGFGASPAAAGVNIYSVGVAGLVASGPTPARLDVSNDGARTTDDLYEWESLEGARDVDANGQVTATDREQLIRSLRGHELISMMEGRP